MTSLISYGVNSPDVKLLAIETATECCSAALLSGDEVIAVSEIAPRRHNEIILSMCERVLALGDVSLGQLDGVAFGRGPGAFTGVRLAASVTQGIALAQDLPVVPVSSLAALAQAAHHKHQSTQTLPCIDARMQEVYYALYELSQDEIMQLTGDEYVIKPALIEIEVSDDCIGVGTGWGAYAKILLARCRKEITYYADALPQAEYIAKLGKYYFEQGCHVPAVQALPVYLRDNVAEKPARKMVF